MLTQENNPASLVNPDFLSTLDTDQLNDLFHHKNRILTVALVSGIRFRDYIVSLKEEMGMIEAELEQRKLKSA